jgi:peptide methionine sulfoxide reductase msrA/msrB
MKRWVLFIMMLFATGNLLLGNAQGEEKKDMEKTNIATEAAILAGGCFWCVESDLEKVPGVVSVISGYTGGRDANPTYENYAASGHIEAVEVRYGPRQISYEKLLDVFWKGIYPTDPGGQFVDRGPQYRSAIFYLNEEQRVLAERSKAGLAKSGRFDKPIVTEILKAGKFYPAEEYHQDYYKKNPLRYKFYRSGSGRDSFLKKVWGEKK